MNTAEQITPNLMMIDVDLLDIDDQPMPEQNPETVARMEAAIKEHRVIEPIMVKEKGGGRYKIVAGRTRYKIAKKLGYKLVPCNNPGNDNLLDYRLLSYDLEICRRQLTPDQMKELERERTKIKNTSSTSFRENLSRKLSPKMKTIFDNLCDKGEMTKEWRVLFLFMADLPQAKQKVFFDNNTTKNGKDVSDEKDELIDSLNDKIDELERTNENLAAKGSLYPDHDVDVKQRLGAANELFAEWRRGRCP